MPDKTKISLADAERGRVTAELECLMLWHEESKRTGWIPGQPIDETKQPSLEYLRKCSEIMAPYTLLD